MVIEKETEISKLQIKIENDYLPVNEHEKIVNENITKYKSEQSQEIEKLCDQFEKEFMTAQDEFEQEKEIIRNEFREQINMLNNHVEELTDQYNDTKNEYQTVVQKIADFRQENDKLKNEIEKLTKDLTNANKSSSKEAKNLEDSVFRLNKELNDKNKTMHQLEMQKEMAEKGKSDAEIICRNTTSTFEKKLKTLASESEEKIKQVVSLNVEAGQKLLKAEEGFKEAKKELSTLKHEHDDLVSRYDVLNHQHHCLIKELDDKEDYMNVLQGRLKNLKSKHKRIVSTVMQGVGAKCKQMKEELQFIKK